MLNPVSPKLAEAQKDGRRFRRVPVHLLGRYMLPDRREFECSVIDMSPGGVSMNAPVCGKPGDRVVAYLDHVGRVEGKLTRLFKGGFAMSIEAGERKREKLANQLTWLVNRSALGLPEDRRFERVTPTDKFTQMTLSDGRTFPCRIIDMSRSGAAIRASVVPNVGSPVTLGNQRGLVVRAFDDGFAMEFSDALTDEELRQQFGAVA
ncbi:PilZ domain-containing protein [Tepidamorphus sp. 3E244]|uniref:PilZ domain-containing protein n=1 Tax=Tepidamorphus sp. 3E244 TaxID=3385498 RepID=UPI0038FBFA0A